MNLTLLLITLASLGLAVAMSSLAWRAVGDQRRRSEARIAALSAEIDDEIPLRFPDSPPKPATIPAARPETAATVSDLFTVSQENKGRSRMSIAVAAGALIVGTVIALAVVFSRGGAPAASAGVKPGSSEPSAPIELVALDQQRDADHLTVNGVVRNPSNGLEMSRLTAVVLVFNSEGNVVATARAAVEAPALAPGSETAFAVIVPGAVDVGKFRVSFTADDHVVPHVDKRHGA